MIVIMIPCCCVTVNVVVVVVVVVVTCQLCLQVKFNQGRAFTQLFLLYAFCFVLSCSSIAHSLLFNRLKPYCISKFFLFHAIAD